MCGIASILRLDQTRVDPADLRRMCSAITHRGPDDAGFALLHHGTVGLGHVRLSLFALDRVERRLSARYLAGPALGIYLDNASAFEDVPSLRPGHYLVADADGAFAERPYYRQTFHVREEMTFDEAAGAVRERLTAA